MSWKLAELKWRHDIGLYESRWEKSSGTLPLERKRAIEAFERRDRKSRSWSPSRRFGKQSFAGEQDVGLGERLLPASTPPRSQVGSASAHTTPPRLTQDRDVSCSGLVPLLQHTSRASALTQRLVLDEAAALGLPAASCENWSALSGHSSRFRPPSSHPATPSEAGAEQHRKHPSSLKRSYLQR
jgi:hypothetical protein